MQTLILCFDSFSFKFKSRLHTCGDFTIGLYPFPNPPQCIKVGTVCRHRSSASCRSQCFLLRRAWARSVNCTSTRTTLERVFLRAGLGGTSNQISQKSLRRYPSISSYYHDDIPSFICLHSGWHEPCHRQRVQDLRLC